MARGAAVALAAAGIYSSYAVGIGDKLLSRMSLDGWDFPAGPWSFFLHHFAIVELYAVVAHQVSRRIAQGLPSVAARKAGKAPRRKQPEPVPKVS